MTPKIHSGRTKVLDGKIQVVMHARMSSVSGNKFGPSSEVLLKTTWKLNLPMAVTKEFIKMNEDMLQDDLMTMMIQKEYAKYFDIPEEQWNFENIGTKLHEAHTLCAIN